MDVSENAAVAVTLCAGAVIVDDEGRLLVVLRRNEPSRGRWSVPGGRVEPGEALDAAARREVFEETGLHVAIGAQLGVVHQRYVDGAGHERVLQIHDFAATVTAGTLTAGDDALDARWLSLAELHATELTPGLLQALADFSVELQ